jgi:hypothetical protein
MHAPVATSSILLVTMNESGSLVIVGLEVTGQAFHFRLSAHPTPYTA